MLPPGSIAHRRDDGETVGWIYPDGNDWSAIDLLGRVALERGEWLDAEAELERIGIAWLANRWVLERDGRTLAVLLVEVTPERIVVKTDDFGAIDAPVELVTLAWPLPPELREQTASDNFSLPWG